ncbi:MAG: hypothetical protein LC772_10825, partial [Chloroflexi bacterium]|nr:hypothetical protein [Chloroflexota bacterium]
LVLGFGGAILICFLQIVVKIDPDRAAWQMQSVLTLFSGVIFWLALIGVLNAWLRYWRPGWALSPVEFSVIYTVTTVAASIGAADELMQLFPVWVYPFRATQKDLMGPFLRYIPHWLAPRSPAVVEPYYLGLTNFFTPALLRAWAVPFFFWMTWIAAFGVTMWSWNVILRRRWMDHDRLSFPNAQLPLEICRSAGFAGAVAGPLFWGGFALAAALESLNQLHGLYPIVPSIPLSFSATPVLDVAPRPWNALSPMSLDWNTLYLGVAYFVPLDILFSGWFLFLFRKMLEVLGYAAGWRVLGWDAKGFPFTRSQAAGAWIALFFILVWAERKHLLRVLAAAMGRGTPEDDSEEFGSYKWAGRLLLAGTAYLMAFSIAGGMSISLAIVFYAFFWMLNVTMTRIYAQVGPPILELYFLDPQTTITTVFGTYWQSPASLVHFSLMYWINRTDRGQPMAHQLTAFRVARAADAPPRATGRIVLAAFVVGALTCLLGYLYLVYRVGEDQFVTGGWRESFSPVVVSRINTWIKTPKGPDLVELGAMVVGAAVTLRPSSILLPGRHPERAYHAGPLGPAALGASRPGLNRRRPETRELSQAPGRHTITAATAGRATLPTRRAG